MLTQRRTWRPLKRALPELEAPSITFTYSVENDAWSAVLTLHDSTRCSTTAAWFATSIRYSARCLTLVQMSPAEDEMRSHLVGLALEDIAGFLDGQVERPGSHIQLT